MLCVEDGKKAFDAFTELGNKIDLIILDVMMPHMDGWEVLKGIKGVSNVPVIMLTAKAEEADQLTGFRLGANDYVSKPFSPSVLVARVENLLKGSGKLSGEELTLGNISIDKNEHLVYVDDLPVDLTPKEFDMLVYFIQNNGIALSRDTLLNSVWNYDYYGDLRTVDTHVKQLRAKLGKYGAYIQTIRGVGYKMRCTVETIN